MRGWIKEIKYEFSAYFRNLSLFRLQMDWSQSHLTHQVLQLGGHPSGQTAAREAGGAVRHEPGGVEGEQTFISTILCENDIKFLFQKADFGWGPNAHFNVNGILHLKQFFISQFCSSPSMGAPAPFGSKWPKCCRPTGSSTM